MKRLALLAAVALSATAAARPWNGVDPGVTTRDEVVKRFGEPSRVVAPSETVEILAYLKERAIRGTNQVQFRVDRGTGIVQRIDVFPQAQSGVDKDAIENTYGRACPQGPLPESPCYLKKITEDFRVYFHYPRAGMAVFFDADGKTVNSLIFEPQKQVETAQKKSP